MSVVSTVAELLDLKRDVAKLIEQVRQQTAMIADLEVAVDELVEERNDLLSRVNVARAVLDGTNE